MDAIDLVARSPRLDGEGGPDEKGGHIGKFAQAFGGDIGAGPRAEALAAGGGVRPVDE